MENNMEALVSTLKCMLEKSTKDAVFEFFKCACLSGDISICQACIDAEFNPNMCDTMYGTPILFKLATYEGFSKNIAEFLINNGAKIEIMENYSFISPLSAACYSGNLELVKYFISKGCTVIREGYNADLKIAIRHNHVEVIKFLLESQLASVNDDKYLEYELIRDENFEMLELLLRFGANPNDDEIFTAATELKNTKMAEILLKYGANPNKGEELSPIHIAAIYDNIDMAKLLLDNGADVNARIQCTSTICKYDGALVAIDIAMFKNNEDMIKLLSSYGGKPTERMEQLVVLNEIRKHKRK